jgi:hypothetical protein
MKKILGFVLFAIIIPGSIGGFIGDELGINCDELMFWVILLPLLLLNLKISEKLGF